MKKSLTCLMLMLALLLAGGEMSAKTAPKKKGSSKKSSSALTVTKGAKKSYGDYLETQIFSIKKGKDSKITVEYPLSGNTQLVNAIRKDIKNELDAKFTGSLDTPDALIRNAIKPYGASDYFLDVDIKIIYHNSNIVTLFVNQYEYGGGAHGQTVKYGLSYLVSDGTLFNDKMLPPFSDLRNDILKGLAESERCTEQEVLNNILFSPEALDHYGLPYIDGDKLVFIYQHYEIAPYMSGILIANVPVTNKIKQMLSPEGQKFFK